MLGQVFGDLLQNSAESALSADGEGQTQLPQRA
jgi:hypothetical protein